MEDQPVVNVQIGVALLAGGMAFFGLALMAVQTWELTVLGEVLDELRPSKRMFAVWIVVSGLAARFAPNQYVALGWRTYFAAFASCCALAASGGLEPFLGRYGWLWLAVAALVFLLMFFLPWGNWGRPIYLVIALVAGGLFAACAAAGPTPNLASGIRGGLRESFHPSFGPLLVGVGVLLLIAMFLPATVPANLEPRVRFSLVTAAAVLALWTSFVVDAGTDLRVFVAFAAGALTYVAITKLDEVVPVEGNELARGISIAAAVVALLKLVDIIPWDVLFDLIPKVPFLGFVGAAFIGASLLVAAAVGDGGAN